MESQAAPSHVGINIRTWFEVHKKRVLYVSVGALVLIVAVAVFVQSQANKEIAASQALSEIRLPFSPAVPPPPGAAQKLFELANEHKGTKAAARALHLSAGLLFVEKDYAHAQERFNALVQTYPESPWVPDANLGIAACLEAQGKTDEAVKKYEDITKRHSSATIIDDAKLSLARLYEKSRPADAWRLYDELITSERTSGSGLAMQAGMRQEELVKRNPELASLRPPPPAPPVPTNRPVQITMNTNRPAANTGFNRTITFTNTLRPGATNPGNAPSANSPIQIKVNPAPAPGTAPTPGTAPAPGTPPPGTAPSPAPAAPAPAPPPAPAPAPPPQAK